MREQTGNASEFGRGSFAMNEFRVHEQRTVKFTLRLVHRHQSFASI